MTPKQKRRILIAALEDSIWSMQEWVKGDDSLSDSQKAWAERQIEERQEVLAELEGEDDA